MNESEHPKLRIAADGDRYITTKSKSYENSIRIAIEYFENIGYTAHHGYICYNEKNRVQSIANIFCIPKDSSLDNLALIIAFPKARRHSTKRILERLGKMQNCWSNIGAILAYETGSGLFPVIVDRIWRKGQFIRIFTIDLNKRIMRELMNPEPKNEKG